MSPRFLATLALLLAAGPLHAKPATSRPVSDRPSVTLDPTKAYVLVRSSSPTPLTLLRESDEQERADWLVRRTAAFTKAQRRYFKDKAAHDANNLRYQAASPAVRGTMHLVEAAPIEVTEANFPFAPAIFDHAVPIGPTNRFSKNDGALYLHELPAGAYIFYGPIFVSEAGGVGSCLCMGTVRFTVTPGAITDLGTVAVVAGKADDALATQGFALTPATAGTPIDPRIASFSHRFADFRAYGRLPNLYGVTIDRLRPVEGVLRYERDHVIDVVSGADVAAAPPAGPGS